MDLIEIRELRARAIIGVDDRERREKQEVVLTLKLHTDTRSAGRSDDLKDSLDYRSVSERILEFTESSNFLLVEKLAEEIARLCVLEFGVPRVSVTVEKPKALESARSVGVTIEREASDYR